MTTFNMSEDVKRKLKIHVAQHRYKGLSEFIRSAIVEKMEKDNNK